MRFEFSEHLLKATTAAEITEEYKRIRAAGEADGWEPYSMTITDCVDGSRRALFIMRRFMQPPTHA